MTRFLGQSDLLEGLVQSVLLRAPRDLTDVRLQRVLQILIDRHDSLRLQFTRAAEGNPTLQILPKGAIRAEDCLTRMSFSQSDESDDRDDPIKARRVRVQSAMRVAIAQIRPADGHMLHVVWICEETAASLLFVIHHLAVDGVSWRILSEDLADTWAKILSDEQEDNPSVPLPEERVANTSFRAYALRLKEMAGSVQAFAELPFWESTTNNISKLFPECQLEPAMDKLTSAQHMRLEFNADLTTSLFSGITNMFRLRGDEILLAALAIAIAAWQKNQIIQTSGAHVDIESHGRYSLDSSMDLSMTTGWFTSIYPVLLRIEQSDLAAVLNGGSETARCLKQVKEQLRSIPCLLANEASAHPSEDDGRGLGYGLLRHVAKVESLCRDKRGPDVGFNYLGRVDASSTLDWSIDYEAWSWLQEPESSVNLLHLLEINAMTVDRGDGLHLVADWIWRGNAQIAEAVSSLADYWQQALEAFVKCLWSTITDDCKVLPCARFHTPSDFPLVRITQEQIDKIEAAVPRLSDVLPLSPLQEGIIFHALYDTSGPDLYTVQISLEIEGDLNPARLRHASNLALSKHPNLRSAFIRVGGERPVQAIAAEIEVPWKTLDLSMHSGNEAELRVQERVYAERNERFRLDKPPLLRLLLAKLPSKQKTRHLFVLSYHHLLMDGWSLPLFIGEIFTAYRDEVSYGASPVRITYKNYLNWVQKQSREAACAAWSEYLAGIAEPTLLAHPANAMATSVWPERWQTEVPKETTAKINALAHSWGVTPSIVLQGLWGLLMALQTGKSDVICGITVSGRPPEVPDIERIIGLCIATVPFRIQIKPSQSLSSFFTGLQRAQGCLASFHYVGLSEIQQAVRMDELFDTLIVVENYPMNQAQMETPAPGLRITGAEPDDATHYPVNLLMTPGERLHLRLQYDPSRLDPALAHSLGTSFVQLMEDIALRPESVLGDLTLLRGAERERVLALARGAERRVPAATLHGLF
ncbi:MAG: condensation domain-containing protein, partial [Terracidiphilus sp.]